MAASGKTSNYNIPIYQPNDTANYLTSYNGGMNIIDTQLRANADAAAAAESKAVMVEGKADANSLAIQEVGNKVDGIQLPVRLTVDFNTQNVPSGGYNSLYQLLGVTEGLVYSGLNKRISELPVKVKAGSDYLIPFFSVDGNIFNLSEGAENNTTCGIIIYIYQGSSGNDATSIHGFYTWLIGGKTFFGLNVSNPDSTDLIKSCYINVIKM